MRALLALELVRAKTRVPEIEQHLANGRAHRFQSGRLRWVAFQRGKRKLSLFSELEFRHDWTDRYSSSAY